MNRILQTSVLAPEVKYFRVDAPKIARKHRAGQFVIVRLNEGGERIPLTIADSDPDDGWIALIVQGLGRTTRTMNLLEEGDLIRDVAGPLGMPTEIDEFGTVVVVGGGVGTAIIYPAAVALAHAGNDVIAIVGGRSNNLVLLESELKQVCTQVLVTTDDGSRGHHGLVTDELQRLLESGRRIDRILAAGPVPMMRAVAEVSRPHGVPTIASLNPIMVDGTGMCGGCRVSIGGETQFACVDGPEFDAHDVDFELLERRNASYRALEHDRNERFTNEHCHMQAAMNETR